MKYFIIDGDSKSTYDELLKYVNSGKLYVNAYKAENILDFLINLIIALINNKNIDIIDNDFDDISINANGIALNETQKIDNVTINTIEDLITRIKESTSEITLFTSGTTGQPKKVIHKVNNLRRYVKSKEKNKRQIWGLAYNYTHIAGLLVILQAIENINTVVNIFNKDRDYIFEKILKYKITNISATPTFYRLLLPTEKIFKSMEYITLGGEKSDNALCNKLRIVFPNAKINNIYASTEAGSLLTSEGENFKIPTKYKDKIKIINQELHIHGSLIGRFNDVNLVNGYYSTSDLIEWIEKEKGIFKFKGRRNELINVGGYNVNPLEIEDNIRLIKGVINVKVMGKKNSIIGNILIAEIQMEKNCEMTENKIKLKLREKLQEYKIPRIIKFTENIELTRTGKLQRT